MGHQLHAGLGMFSRTVLWEQGNPISQARHGGPGKGRTWAGATWRWELEPRLASGTPRSGPRSLVPPICLASPDPALPSFLLPFRQVVLARAGLLPRGQLTMCGGIGEVTDGEGTASIWRGEVRTLLDMLEHAGWLPAGPCQATLGGGPGSRL